MPSVLHNHAERRFEMQVEGQVAFLSYRIEDNHVILDHTYVPEALRGRGLAAQLVRAALAHGRQQGWNVTARCTYAAKYLQRHPKSADERPTDQGDESRGPSAQTSLSVDPRPAP